MEVLCLPHEQSFGYFVKIVNQAKNIGVIEKNEHLGDINLQNRMKSCSV